jgi:serralysin
MKPVWTSEQVVGQLTKWQGRWDNSVPVPFMFYAQSLAHHEFKTNFISFSQAERQSLVQTMQLVSDVANISFVNMSATTQAPSKTNPFLGFYTIKDAAAPFWGAATRYVMEGSGPPAPMGRIYGADIVVNHQRSDVQGGWNVGDSNSRKLMHELLHGLGLSHAGDYNGDSATGYEKDATYFQDSNQYTVMSYWGADNTGANHSAGGFLQFASTPLLYDVAALQKLYGANMSTRTGDTVYGFNNTSGRSAFDLALDPSAVFTIWDAGGVDTLDLSGYSSASRVDLRDGAFSDAGGMTSNISIALGALIENAIGGSGNDSLTGNSAANRLTGGGGDDRLAGGMGDDRLEGGDGTDTAEFTGSRSGYQVAFLSGGQVRVTGIEGSDLLIGIERLKSTTERSMRRRTPSAMQGLRRRYSARAQPAGRATTPTRGCLPTSTATASPTWSVSAMRASIPRSLRQAASSARCALQWRVSLPGQADGPATTCSTESLQT